MASINLEAPPVFDGMIAADTHPWEENRGIGYSFGYNRNEPLSNYKSAQELVLMLVDLVSRGGNLLLDVGPTADGRIPMIMQSRLLEIGDWLNVNGEAVYGSGTWKKSCQWSEGQRPKWEFKQQKSEYNLMESIGKAQAGKAVMQAFFISQSGLLYAVTSGWPGRQLVLHDVEPRDNAKVTMLGLPGSLPWRVEGNKVIIDVSGITADELPCRWAYTFRIPIKKPAEKPNAIGAAGLPNESSLNSAAPIDQMPKKTRMAKRAAAAVAVTRKLL